jgi:hypothetical protein
LCLFPSSSQRAIVGGGRYSGPTKFEWGVQPDALATISINQSAVCLIDPRATTKRDDTDVRFFQQPAQHVGFDCAKSRFSVFNNELRWSSSFPLSDFLIEIDHRDLEPPGQFTSDTTLPAAHETRNHNWYR